MATHQQGLYQTKKYKELLDVVDGFNAELFLSKHNKESISTKHKLNDLKKFESWVTEYKEIMTLAKTVFAVPFDEARLRRLFIDINEFIDNRPELFI